MVNESAHFRLPDFVIRRLRLRVGTGGAGPALMLHPAWGDTDMS